MEEDIKLLKERIEELEKSENELLKTKDELQEALRLKSAFVSTVSHELRTPLAAIKEGIDSVLDEIVGAVNVEQRGAFRYRQEKRRPADALDQ